MQIQYLQVRGKNVQAQGDITISVFVVLLEHIGHTLKADARLHKQIEADSILSTLVIGTEQQRHECGRQTIAE